MATKNIKGITIELNGDTTALDKALKDVVKESVKIQGELKEVEKSLKFNPGNTELIAQKQQLLADQIETTSKKLNTLKEAQAQVEQQFRNGTINGEQYRAFQRELVNTESHLGSLQTRLAAVGQDQQELESKTRQLQTLFAATGTDVDQFADALGVGLTNAIKSGNASIKQLDTAIDKIGQAALGSSIDVDKLKAALRSADDGNSLQNIRQDLSQVSDEAKKAGNEVNEFGSELTSVISGLAAGGGIAGIVSKALDTSSLSTKINISFDVPEESKQSVLKAIKGIEVYGVDGQEALEGVRRQWALNKNASDEANESLVKQAATVASAYAGIDFIELIQETNEFASALQISNEEALALTNALLKAGFPPEQLDTLAEYGTQMKDAGFSAKEIQAIFEAGINTKSWNIDNLNDGVKEARIQMATFGQEVPAAVQPLLEQAGLAEEKFQAWGKAVAAGGEQGSKAMYEMVTWLNSLQDKALKNEIATKVFGTKWEDQGQNMIAVFQGVGNAMDQTGQNADLLNNQMETLNADPAIQMQQAMTDMNIALTPLLTSIAEFVAKIAGWASENPILATTLTVIVTVLGLVLAAALALTPTILAMTTATGGFGVALNAAIWPVTLIVAAIAALAAGLIYLYNNNETVRNGLTAAWEWIKEAATTIFGYLKDFWAKWGDDILAFFSANWEIIKTVFKTVFDAISIVVKTIFEGIKEFWAKWGDTIMETFKNVFEILKTVFKTVFDVISTVIKTIFNGIKSFWDKWGDTITTVFKTALNVVKSVFEGVWNGIKIVVETVIGVISGIVKTWLAIFKGDWKGAWEGVKETVKTIWDGITGLFSNAFDTMKNIGKNIIEGLINGIKSMKDAVVKQAKDIANSIGNEVKDFFGIHSPSRLMLGYGTNIVQGLANGISDTARQAVKSAAAVSSAVAGAMTIDSSFVSASVSAGSSVLSGETNTTASGSAGAIYMDGMFNGATIIMRNDDDIRTLAREIWNLGQKSGRAGGNQR
ncbi:hypothetical protein D3C74_137570 [compost metagenome]